MKRQTWFLSLILLILSGKIIASEGSVTVHTRSGDKVINSQEIIKKTALKAALKHFPGLLDQESENKRVFGTYIRDEVSKTDSNEFRLYGQIGDFCTGTLVGPKHVLTAAHCVYSHRSHDWNSEIYFSPGRKLDHKPFGTINWSKVYVMTEYLDNMARNYDFAIIVLEKEVGHQLGWLNISHKPELKTETNANVHITGYPGDKPLGTMWKVECPLTGINEFNGVEYICDTYGGMSGSALVYQNEDSQKRTVFGIHTYGAATSNGGVFINAEVEKILTSWINDTDVEGDDFAENNSPLPSSDYHNVVFENKCEQTVWTAIRHQTLDGKWVVKGWWKLKPGQKTLAGRTTLKSFYVYGETDDRSQVWDGSDFNSPIRDRGDYGFKEVKITHRTWAPFVHQFTCDE